MNRFIGQLVSGFAALVALVFLSLTVAADAQRPNILFIMSDDHAAHAMSCYGSRINQTPNLDRIARNGMLFNNCFAVNAICTPSRATILTGKYSHMNGVPVFNRFDGSQPHVAKMLKAAGYQTAMIGKWHLFSDPTGFDYWNVLPGQGKYNDPVMIEMGKTNQLKGYVTDIITDLSIDFLKRRDTNRPFLLFCHHKAPHREWTPDAKHAAMYDGKDIPEPATFNDDYSGRSAAAIEATMRIDRDLKKTDLKQNPPAGLSGAELKKWKYQRYIKDYLGCIASVDDNVGRLLDFMEQSGLATNTLIIYTSDQGFFLGDHGWFDKRFMYEESLRMPFIVSYPPLIKPRSTNERMILNVDFAPTFLHLAGLPVPGDMQGRSILPLLKDEAPANWRTSMYYRYYHYPRDHRVQPHWGFRTERYKLIYFNKLDEWELYDLKSDPYETNNIYSASSTVADRLKTELARLKTELNDRDQYADVLDDGEKFQSVPLKLLAQFANAGGIETNALDLAAKTFTIGARLKAESESGVVMAMGGASQGFTLYLSNSIPHFAIRSAGNLFVLRGKESVPIGRSTHIAALLRSTGAMALFVNGKPSGNRPAAPITRKPQDGFTIGADPGSRVGPYDSAFPLRGEIRDARVYAGEFAAEEIETWAAE